MRDCIVKDFVAIDLRNLKKSTSINLILGMLNFYFKVYMYFLKVIQKFRF